MASPVKRDKPWRQMFKLRFFKVVIVVSGLLWLAAVLLPTIRVLPVIYGKTAVPLHYNIHVGVDTVAPWWRIYVVPALGLLIVFVNMFLARFMWPRDPVLAYVIGAATVLLQVVLMVAMVFIVYLSLQYA
jgi:hypothetical protein